MKGVVFGVVEDVVTELFGPDAWDDLLEAAGLPGTYHALGDYPDADLVSLVQAASQQTGRSVDEVLLAVGRCALKYLVANVEDLVADAGTPFAFLRLVHGVIHVEVFKLFQNAAPPHFDYEDLPDGGLRMTYRSSRCLAGLAEGLIHGVGDRYGTALTVVRTPISAHAVQFDIRAAA